MIRLGAKRTPLQVPLEQLLLSSHCNVMVIASAFSFRPVDINAQIQRLSSVSIYLEAAVRFNAERTRYHYVHVLSTTRCYFSSYVLILKQAFCNAHISNLPTGGESSIEWS